MPEWAYAIRGVEATDIKPQTTSKRNFIRLPVLHEDSLAATTNSTIATIGTNATNARSTPGSLHHGHSFRSRLERG
jgi:hypothetical protein